MSRGLIFALSLLFFSQHGLAFEEAFSRYLGGHDILRVFNQKFPSVRQVIKGGDGEQSPRCIQLNLQDQPRSGMNAVLTGEPLQKRPQRSFLDWYSFCVSVYLEADRKFPFEGLSSAKWRSKYISNRLVVQLPQWNTERDPTDVLKDKSIPYSSLSEASQSELDNYLVKFWLGPQFTSNESIRTQMKKIRLTKAAEPLFDVIQTQVGYLMLTDEFLLY